jgi:hypothetical protein
MVVAVHGLVNTKHIALLRDGTVMGEIVFCFIPYIVSQQQDQTKEEKARREKDFVLYSVSRRLCRG